VRLADVVGELLHALVEALKSIASSQLLLDDVDMPARFHVLQHRARGVRTAISVVGETIQTRFALAYSTTSAW